MNAFAGYFSTSDNAEQAFRWGVGTTLAPFGQRVSTEIFYSSSQTRTGILPNTEVLSARLGINLKWGLKLLPGIWADLQDQPLYGISVGLKYDAGLSKKVFTPKESASAVPAPPIPRRSGVVLVPPAPESDVPLAGKDELWKELCNASG